MEQKEYKPVPDVECLKYHGTPEKPDIKIFVSHRIDLDSETIDNPLYIPVRCGAVYDERENVTMLGDDTGDNISEKRMTFNELTVQYWAWKNVQADYYGLCHYRRFFSFSEEKCDISIGGSYTGCTVEDCLSSSSVKAHKLDDDIIMSEDIAKADVTIFSEFDVRKAGFQSIKRSMSIDSRSFDYKDMEKCLEIIKKDFGEIYPYALAYLNGHNVTFYNCFIMKRELFHELSEFEFAVLSELEHIVDISKYSIHKQRVFGLIAEHLVGIWMKYKQAESSITIHQRQVVYFDQVEKVNDVYPAFDNNNVTVVLASSDFFSPYLGVCLQSIADTSSLNHNYDIIILERGIAKQNKEKLLKIKGTRHNISIRFLNVQQRVSGLNFYINGDRLSQETYYGLLTSWFLPHHDRAIIMDCDMIVCRDIADLYAYDIRNVYAGVVRDVVFYGLLNDTSVDTYAYCTEKLGIKNPYNYFNGGLIYLNMDRFRKTFSLKQISGYINKYKLRIVDQDMFNMLLENKVLFVDPRWNHMIEIEGWVKNNLNYAPAEDYLSFEKARKDPFIIHYANVIKPWDDPDVEFADAFWESAKKTPFYEAIIYRSWKTTTNMLHQAVFDAGNSIGLYDTRSGARKFADKLLPKGSRRRKFAKKLLPKGSLRWRFCKQIYYVFKPQYRPKKITADKGEEE